MAAIMPQNELPGCANEICIFTLGKFYIRQNDSIISAGSSRSKRMWEIFKYLLTHQGKSFFPENILESIWPDNDYADPSLVLRAQIYRLRQVLKNEATDLSLATNVVFSQGCYSWEEKVSYWLDVDEFESLATEAERLKTEEPEEAEAVYRRAIALYRGEYLPESSFSEWIEPMRSYYHDIFLNSVFSLADIYKKKRAYSDIIKLCEHAASIDYFEEKIHLRLIEALMAEGHHKRARAHYNEVTSYYYRELGIKPSEQMKNLYRLLGVEPGAFELDLSTIQEGLKGKESISGAYYCDAELFRYFYKLERLRVERNGHSVLLGLLTLTSDDYRTPPEKELVTVMNNLQQVILDSLRKGDLVTRWNKAQFLLLLPGLSREQAVKVMERIGNNFMKHHSLLGLNLHKKIESLLPLEGDAHFF